MIYKRGKYYWFKFSWKGQPLYFSTGERRGMSKEEREGAVALPTGSRVFRIDNLTKPGPGSRYEFEFDGKKYDPGKRWWGTTPGGMAGLAKAKRLSLLVGND